MAGFVVYYFTAEDGAGNTATLPPSLAYVFEVRGCIQ